ncbi:MAG: DMT family transporter [Promethearchaeota archaeon]
MLLIYFLLILMILIWSFSFIIVDVAVEFIPPLCIALYRFVISSAAFLIMDFYFKMRGKNNFKENAYKTEKTKFLKKDYIFLIIASLTGSSFFFIFQYSAISIIGPSLPALFICLLSPVFITILSLIFFNERLSWVKGIGFIIASIGGFLLVTGGNLNTLTPKSPNFLGYLFALVTPLLWAIYTIIIKKITKNNSHITTLKYVTYLGTIELFLFVLINNEFLIFLENLLNFPLFLCGLYIGLGCHIFGYYIWQYSNNELKSSKVASFLYVEPFLTICFSFLLQRSEVILIGNIIGGVVVLVALLLINYK